jgi:hypothetical protein
MQGDESRKKSPEWHVLGFFPKNNPSVELHANVFHRIAKKICNLSTHRHGYGKWHITCCSSPPLLLKTTARQGGVRGVAHAANPAQPGGVLRYRNVKSCGEIDFFFFRHFAQLA